MKVRVWAFRVGNFVESSASGWAYAIRFNSLKDLIAGMSERKLNGRVESLAIVAHGDASGVVQLDSNLTPTTINNFTADLAALADFLDPHAKLIFISCLAGSGKEGDQLLTGISRILSNVHVIGFTIQGAMAQEGLPSAAGQVLEGQNFMRGMPAEKMRGLPALTEYSAFSKWARNGYISRIPIQEQTKQPGYRCAWSSCPGHAHPMDRCQPAIKGMTKPFPYPG
jgi:hypothetical protein